jgi:hypothetical protein
MTTDIEFYGEFVNDDDSVLYIGAGHGRIAQHLKCRELVMVENDADCCESLTSLDIGEVHHEDAATLHLGRTFDVVMIPNNTLGVMGDTDELVRVMAAAASHLDPEHGVLVLDVTAAHSVGHIRDTTLRAYDWTEDEVTRVSFETYFDPISGYLGLAHCKPDGTDLVMEDVRVFTLVEMEHLLARVGLNSAEVMADYSEEYPLDERSCNYVIIARGG